MLASLIVTTDRCPSGSELPTWLQVVQALGPLLVGAVAALVAWRTLKQRRQADAKAEWWRRTQWALEQVLSTDPDRANVGTGMLKVLVASDLAQDEKELALFRSTWDDVLEPVVEDLSEDADVVVDEGSDDDDDAEPVD